MSEKGFSTVLDALLCSSPKSLDSFFGDASLSFHSLRVYPLKSGFLAIPFMPSAHRNMELQSSGYVLYDAHGHVVCAQGLTPVAMDASVLVGKTNLQELVDKYGTPHADIGSGMPLLVYLSDHATLYYVQQQSETTCSIQEKPLIQT